MINWVVGMTKGVVIIVYALVRGRLGELFSWSPDRWEHETLSDNTLKSVEVVHQVPKRVADQ